MTCPASSTADVASWPLAGRMSRPPLLASSRTAVINPELFRASQLAPWARPRSVRRLASTGLWQSLKTSLPEDLAVVHVETSVMAPLALAVKSLRPTVKLILDLPDVIWHQKARVLKNRGWRNAAMPRDVLEVAMTWALERQVLNQFDRIITCSEPDRKRVLDRARSADVTLIPNATDIGEPCSLETSEASTLLFVGTMSYEPNQEGVQFFVNSVLPLVLEQEPEARFVIVGKDPPPAVTALATHPGVEVTGRVADLRPYLERATLSVVPLLNGGGTRLKILESMAAMRAVVSTSVGAEGIDAENGRDLLIHDSAGELAAACVRLIRDKQLRNQIAVNGRRLVSEKYDWVQARRELVRVYASLNDR